MKRLTCPLVAMVLACVSAAATTSPSSGHDAPHHAAFDDILKAAVKGERVDYGLIRVKHAAALDKYLDELAEKRVELFRREDQLAYYINLYNASMIRAVLDHRAKDPDWKPDKDDFAVFKEPRVRVRGKTISLDDVEHGIVRKQFNDPRIHAALVCAAESCPPLINRAYKADDLDAVLDERMRAFVSDPARNALDHARKTARLSPLFNWYAADFGGKDKVAAYVGRYLERDLKGYDISFGNYSWQLNDTASAAAE